MVDYPLLKVLRSSWAIGLAGLLALVWISGACTRADEKLTDNPEPLTFSEDAIVFDTVFTGLSTVTQYFHVHNPNKNAVRIHSVRLGNSQSPYQVIVGGKPMQTAQNIDLRGGDSLLVLVKINIPARDSVQPFVLYDSLMFDIPNSIPNIKLLAWGQDVHVLRKQQLSCDQVWEAGKPYLIFDTVTVAVGCKLTIKPGTRVYAFNRAALVVQGSVQALGTAEKPILFSGFRQDGPYRTASGLWQGLTFLQPSQGNLLDFVQIRNAINAVFVDTPDEDTKPDITIQNSILQYAFQGGLLAISSDVDAINVQITHCRDYHFAGLGGGSYRIWHGTILGEPYVAQRDSPAVVLTDIIRVNGIDRKSDLKAEIKNTVVSGILANEVGLSHTTEKLFLTVFTKNVLKTTYDPGFYDPSNLFGVEPKFNDSVRQDYSPALDSPLFNSGQQIGVLRDINGKLRDPSPDIGAYER